MSEFVVASASSVLGGVFFSSGWLVWIDAIATAGASVGGMEHVPGILSTLGLLMLNIVPWRAVVAQDSFDSEGGSGFARCWVFVALCLSFGGLISSMIVLVQNEQPDTRQYCSAWQSGLIFVCCLHPERLLLVRSGISA